MEEDSAANEDDPDDETLLHIVSGTIGPIKNPWSLVELKMSMIQYWQGCDKVSVPDKTSRKSAIEFEAGLLDLEKASLTASKEEVGASGPSNTVTLKFKPTTKLPDGGSIELVTPPLYSDL